MIPELGQLTLVLALLLSVLQGSVPLLCRFNRPYALMYLTKSFAALVFFMLTASFAALIACYVLSDFSVMNVVLNSHSAKPLLYKIVGAWGNHEGSMMLWIWILSSCGFLAVLLPARDLDLKYMMLSVLGLISAGFLAFIIFTSNPFLRVFPIPAEGEDLNPILQDIGLALHPPTLYVGYVGFGIVFAYAIAGLLLRRIDRDWAKAVQPWILLPWSFLTFGIAAGSWWAYRELGWGGWWFWDPVENVSLLPWLVGTALLHSNMVLERRGQLGGWVVLLAILTFTLSLIGTFIVRSGLITSVHAFASDPTRGMFILAYIGVVSGAALFIYSLRGVQKTIRPELLSRSGFILINNLLLVGAAALILIAILYPLILELCKLPSISVGAPYYNATFLPMTALLPFLAALAPLMAWDRTSKAQLIQLVKMLSPALLIACFITLSLFAFTSALAFAGVGLGAWLLYGTMNYVAKLNRANVSWFSVSGVRHLAAATAHTGLAVFVVGMVMTSFLKQTYEVPLTSKKPMVLGDYTVRVVKAERSEQDTYVSRKATLEVSKDGVVITQLQPELRYYAVRGMQTTEASLYSTPMRDIYMVLGESNYQADKKHGSPLGLRMYVTPGQQLIWAGFLLAGIGGFLALFVAFFTRKS